MRQREEETKRRSDGETKRRRDGETERRRDFLFRSSFSVLFIAAYISRYFFVPLSLRLTISPSLHHSHLPKVAIITRSSSTFASQLSCEIPSEISVFDFGLFKTNSIFLIKSAWFSPIRQSFKTRTS